MNIPRFYVYVLAHPDGTPFYVGKGQRTRIFDHEREAESGCSCDKCVIIRGFWERGEQMQRHINFATDDEQVALTHERKLIQQYKHQGLCNKQFSDLVRRRYRCRIIQVPGKRRPESIVQLLVREKELSLNDLVRRLNIANSTWQKLAYKPGYTISAPLLGRLADALGVPAHELVETDSTPVEEHPKHGAEG